jgi:hypothetical protein
MDGGVVVDSCIRFWQRSATQDMKKNYGCKNILTAFGMQKKYRAILHPVHITPLKVQRLIVLQFLFSGRRLSSIQRFDYL